MAERQRSALCFCEVCGSVVRHARCEVCGERERFTQDGNRGEDVQAGQLDRIRRSVVYCQQWLAAVLELKRVRKEIAHPGLVKTEEDFVGRRLGYGAGVALLSGLLGILLTVAFFRLTRWEVHGGDFGWVTAMVLLVFAALSRLGVDLIYRRTPRGKRAVLQGREDFLDYRKWRGDPAHYPDIVDAYLHQLPGLVGGMRDAAICCIPQEYWFWAGRIWRYLSVGQASGVMEAIELLEEELADNPSLAYAEEKRLATAVADGRGHEVFLRTE